MPDPVDISAKPTSSASAVFDLQNGDDAIQMRALEIVLATKEENPLRFGRFEVWHPELLTAPGTNQEVTTWFRVAESAEIAFVEQHDRWYQEKVGVIHHKIEDVLVPVGLKLQANDHLVEPITGEQFRVIDVVSTSGVESAKLTREQTTFERPPAGSPTLRLVQVGALVG